MTEKLVKIIDPIGLHARPASILVTTASKYVGNDIKMIMSDTKIIDAKGIMGVLSCAIEADQEFLIRVEGLNSEEVITEFIRSLSNQEILIAI